MSRNLLVLLLAITLSACGSDSKSSTDLGSTDTSDQQGMPDLPQDVADALVPPDVSVDVSPDTTPADIDAAPEDLQVDTTPPDPTFWSAELTKVTDDVKFIHYDGKPFFSLGLHLGTGLVYDGVTGPGQCDKDTMTGYLDINTEKHKKAHEAGANFVYLWGFSEAKAKLVDVSPQFKANFAGEYTKIVPAEKDVIPIFYNGHGESDMEGYKPEKIQAMKDDFAAFMARTGKYTLENMPNLPPVEQVGHMAWHPTFRMIGNETGEGDMLSYQQVTEFAQTTNFMIGDAYTYVENRFDLNIPAEAIMAAINGQIGDKGEGYDDWVAIDDPLHAHMFSTGFDLAHSIRSRSLPETVIWMWVQGYSFGNSIAKDECEGETQNSSWATGGFPHLDYMRKEICGMVAAGATGFIFFGFPDTRMEEAEVMFQVFKAMSHPDVYEPALLSPRLDLGTDTLFLGEIGHQGTPRAHAIVKWHEATKTAYVIASNPGGKATEIEIPFPWTLAKAEALNWETPGFETDPALVIKDKVLHYTMPIDSGVILRITPMMAP